MPFCCAVIGTGQKIAREAGYAARGGGSPPPLELKNSFGAERQRERPAFFLYFCCIFVFWASLSLERIPAFLHFNVGEFKNKCKASPTFGEPAKRASFSFLFSFLFQFLFLNFSFLFVFKANFPFFSQTSFHFHTSFHFNFFFFNCFFSLIFKLYFTKKVRSFS